MTAIARVPGTPNWLRELLFMAAEQLAMPGALPLSVTFTPPGLDANTDRFRASLCWDPAVTTAAVYVHHVQTGRFVCRSLPVVLDEFDASAWNTDFTTWADTMAQAARTSARTTDEDEERRARERMHRQVTQVFGLLARQHQRLAQQVFSVVATRQPIPQLPKAWPVAVPSIPDFVLKLDCPSAAVPDIPDHH